ncbi:GntR family transcriptional regulator [Pigmentiphaga soli]|uniref:GntR family transcriptional regulator n=1 Tax=Pigmentiphaga soli TaxID=1007095 RepID=A0ABP8HQZ8_9BURK
MPERENRPAKERKLLPRYAWLHQCLLQDIGSGKYAVGSLLPTEAELSKAYGVSRHTVREATRRLVDSGMIRRQPSTGTVVTAARPTWPSPSYAAALGTMQEFMAFTERTRLEVFDEEVITLDEGEAGRLRCEVGSRWLLWHANRRLVEEDKIITYTRAMVRPEFESIKDRLHGNHPSMYRMLQEQFGQEVYKVEQEIESVLMPAVAVAQLGLDEGSPALRIVRAYRDRHDRLLTLSDNYYIANRFRLLTAWTKDGA